MNHEETNIISFSALIQIIRNTWYIGMSILALSSITTYGFTEYAIPKTYVATAKIIVVSNQSKTKSMLSYADLQVSQKLAQTYSQIILSERISDIVLLRLHNRITTSQYRSMISVNANQNTEIMNISVAHTNPSFASTVANEIVHVFQNEISTIMPVDNVSILNHAKIPIMHSSPSLMMNMTLGVLLGGMLYLALVMILHLTDRKVKDEQDIKDSVPYPYIGSIPQSIASPSQSLIDNGLALDRNLTTIMQPNSLSAEAYRTIRTSIMLRNFDKQLKIINVVSTTQGEGKTTTIINLAMSLSQIGKKVLIVDLDLRAPKVHKMLRLSNANGITDLIKKDSIAQVSVQSYQSIDIIPAGDTIPFTCEFLQSQVLSRFLTSMKNQYDYVLLDCPPAGILSDGVIVSTMSDGTLLIVGHNMVDKKELSQLGNLLKSFQITIIGSILTKTQAKKYDQAAYCHYDPFRVADQTSPLMKGNG